MKNKPLEKDIQNLICEYLELKRYFFWRVNNIPVYNAQTKSFRAMPKYARKGVPDIIVILLGGKFLGIEVKREGGKQSDKQKLFERQCKDLEAGYLLATSLDDIIAFGL